MHIVSWNIQSTRGCNGDYDVMRIVDTVRKQGDCDVVCLQEVSRHFEEYGSDDQLARITDAFPEHEIVWGAAVSGPVQNGGRQEFGNLTLVKKSLLLDFRIHTLPYPAQENTPQMPRVLVESMVKFNGNAISIFNTHLAYHSAPERYQQVEYICDRVQEMQDRMLISAATDHMKGAYIPFAEPNFILLCGDLNLEPYAKDYDLLTASQSLFDCWPQLYGDVIHSPTCGIYDQMQWTQGPHCRDYFMANEKLTPYLKKLFVDTQTNASDHQPISLILKN